MSWLRSLQYRVLALILALSACSLASAQVEKYLNGTHYRLVPGVPAVPQWQGSADKPNVTEIFWYGCPHCYEFDAVLAAWVASHGDTINFSRSPMIWTPISRQHARIYFVAQSLGLGSQLHKPIFDAIQLQHNNLVNEGAAQLFFAGNGVAADRFAVAWHSTAIDETMRTYEDAMKALHVPSVPALLVNGKYLVYVRETVPSHAAMLEVAEFLLHKPG